MTVNQPRGTFCKLMTECIITTLAVLLLVSLPFAASQEQTVNILLFYEWPETVKAFQAAIDYIHQDPSLEIKVGEVSQVQVNGTDGTKLIMSLCKDIDEAYGKSPEQSPDIVLDLTRHGLNSEAVKLLTKVMTLPTVSGSFGQEGDTQSWKDLTENQTNYLIQIAPPADMVPQAVRSLVSQQDMTSAALLYDDEYEMYHKHKSLLQNMPTRHLLTKLEQSVPRVRRQVDRLVHQDVANFFIAASPPEISHVLAEASDPQMRDGPFFSEEYAWYSLSMEPGLPRCAGCKADVSIIHLSPKLPDGSNKRKDFLMSRGIFKKERLMDFFYFDLTLNAVATVAKMKKDGSWMPPPRRVCREQENSPDDYELQLFENMRKDEISKENILGPFYFDPDKTVGRSHAKFQMTINRLQFRRMNVDPDTLVTLGTWDTGFSERDLITSDGREDQWKQHFAITVYRIVTVVQPPFVYKIPGCDEHKEKYSRCFAGFCIDMLNKIQEELKFNFTIRNVSSYGYMMDDMPHEWDGMVRELKDRKADIAIGAMSVMAERESVVDFTVPFYDLVGISILMKKPPKASTNLFKFLTVLENDVWLSILGGYIFTSLLMWVFDRLSPFSYQNNREKYQDDEEQREFTVIECFWFCLTSLTPQGGGAAPMNLSGRLVAGTWWMFCFIIIASYTSNLAAFMTVSRLDAPIESLEDLSMQYKVQYAPLRYSTAWIYFDRMAHIEHQFHSLWTDLSLSDTIDDYEQSQLSVWEYPISHKYTKIWHAMLENDPPRSYEEAIDRVRGKKNEQAAFAFLDEATNNRYETVISCDVVQIGEEFSRKPYAIAVQKGSPLREAFSHLILKLLNQRHLEQLKEVWWNENALRAECPRYDYQSNGISIYNIGGVFIVIFVGIIMACVTMVFEYLWYRKRTLADRRAEKAKLPQQESGEHLRAEKTNFHTEYAK